MHIDINKQESLWIRTENGFSSAQACSHSSCLPSFNLHLSTSVTLSFISPFYFTVNLSLCLPLSLVFLLSHPHPAYPDCSVVSLNQANQSNVTTLSVEMLVGSFPRCPVCGTACSPSSPEMILKHFWPFLKMCVKLCLDAQTCTRLWRWAGWIGNVENFFFPPMSV